MDKKRFGSYVKLLKRLKSKNSIINQKIKDEESFKQDLITTLHQEGTPNNLKRNQKPSIDRLHWRKLKFLNYQNFLENIRKITHILNLN